MKKKDLQSAALRFAISFVVLFIVSLPFPYRLLPDVGGYLGPCSERLVRWVGDHILHIDSPYTAGIVSDSTGMYIHLLIIAALSLLVCAVWSIVERGRDNGDRLRYLFTAAVSYYLSIQLLKYGLDKLFKHQFYLPEPNTLYTAVGQLSRDILYWSAIGSSRSYNIIAGLLEVIPALLLLFRRTRPIGALGALAVTLHIVAINFGFDISVKLYSCFLLLLCLIVAFPTLTKLWNLLLLKRTVDGRMYAPRIGPGTPSAIYAAVKSLVIVTILLEASFVYVETGNFNDDSARRPFLHGAYAVELFIRNGDTVPPLLTESDRFKRIFIHRRGYFITQSMNDAMRDYSLGYDRSGQRLLLRNNDSSTALGYDIVGPDSLLMVRGVMSGDSIVVHARRLDPGALPLLGPSFHWTIDGYR